MTLAERVANDIEGAVLDGSRIIISMGFRTLVVTLALNRLLPNLDLCGLTFHITPALPQAFRVFSTRPDNTSVFKSGLDMLFRPGHYDAISTVVRVLVDYFVSICSTDQPSDAIMEEAVAYTNRVYEQELGELNRVRLALCEAVEPFIVIENKAICSNETCRKRFDDYLAEGEEALSQLVKDAAKTDNLFLRDFWDYYLKIAEEQELVRIVRDSIA
ncbi:hypothetical protein GMRT_10962 [Giardia muris]|uniref:Uncharacterized protein n=1 Tax=Giardia muris TaxID=5742 RepID=A0A4Z1T5M3_GIAMU|nr:hypothetical protein GMRT_10962 [Giardia muris]|eukprot:TNJ29353.1 hypothetical protein GMRT_10962 [Giardia muris]